MPSDRNTAPTINRIRITDRGPLVSMIFLPKLIMLLLSDYAPETFGGGGAVNCEMSASPRLFSIALDLLDGIFKTVLTELLVLNIFKFVVHLIQLLGRHGLLPRRKDNRVFAQRQHEDRRMKIDARRPAVTVMPS